MMRALVPFTIALVVALGATRSSALPITACGVTIPAKEKGVLQNDVVCHRRCSNDRTKLCDQLQDYDDCPRRKGICEPEWLIIENGATLDLNGHVVTALYQLAGAACGHSPNERGRCTVKGPGSVEVEKSTGIAGGAMDLVLKNITLTFPVGTGGHLVAHRVVIPNDLVTSLYAVKGMRLDDVHFDGPAGVQSEGDITLSNVEVGPDEVDISAAGRIRGHNVTLIGQGGLSARDVVLRHTSSGPNPGGDTATRAAATGRLRLVDSSVVSITSGKPPVLVRSTCETSTVAGSTASWGVCTND